MINADDIRDMSDDVEIPYDKIYSKATQDYADYMSTRPERHAGRVRDGFDWWLVNTAYMMAISIKK